MIFFIIISFGTKGLWYDAPLFPLLSIWIGAGIYIIYDFLVKTLKLKTKILQIFLFLILSGSIIYIPYTKILKRTYNPEEYPWDIELFQICYFLKDAIENENDLNNLAIAYDGYHSHILFYMNILNLENRNIYFIDYNTLDINDVVIASQTEVKDYIESNYKFKIILNDDPAKIYKIIKLKKKSNFPGGAK